MKLRCMWLLSLAVVTALLLQGNLGIGGQEERPPEKKKEVAGKELVIEGELTDQDDKDKVRTGSYCKIYPFKMVKGKSYQIDMKSKDVDSYLRLENSQGEQVAKDDDSGGFPDARIKYTAPDGGEYKIIATTFLGGTGKFTLTAKDVAGSSGLEGKRIELKLKDGTGSIKSSIGETDTKFKNKLHKAIQVEFKEGKTYQIDHMSKAFDAYLYLLDSNGKIVAEDDDGGDGFNSRIAVQDAKAGRYLLIATSLSGIQTGEFTLTVSEKE